MEEEINGMNVSFNGLPYCETSGIDTKGLDMSYEGLPFVAYYIETDIFLPIIMFF